MGKSYKKQIDRIIAEQAGNWRWKTVKVIDKVLIRFVRGSTFKRPSKYKMRGRLLPKFKPSAVCDITCYDPSSDDAFIIAFTMYQGPRSNRWRSITSVENMWACQQQVLEALLCRASPQCLIVREAPQLFEIFDFVRTVGALMNDQQREL